jgi:multidrug efflux pump subunit AcrA (membrane-fusion protein)
MNTVGAPATPSPFEQPSLRPAKKARPWSYKRTLILVVTIQLGAAVLYSVRLYPALAATKQVGVPTAAVRRGDVSLTVTASGDLRGGNPEILAAPMTGGNDMRVIFIRSAGQEVKGGDIVAQLDTTEQEYDLKEAEADLAEAEQHILRARAEKEAGYEEDRYALLKAEADVRLAELEARKNPILSTITAKQNDLAWHTALDRLSQLTHNMSNKQAVNEDSITMQEAARVRAEAQAVTERRNIAAMTLRAHRTGYVSVKQNTVTSFFDGMTLPLFQPGDLVRPGMVVAEILDLNRWEIIANIEEIDRGYLSPGDRAATNIIAVPDRSFRGHVKDLGGTTGPPWDRRFQCNITLDNPSPELRPGMSAKITIFTDELRQVLWLPSQALFESDGRPFVYLLSGTTFTPTNIELVRRNETRIVVSGISEGKVVALASPTEMTKRKSAAPGALQILPK